MPPSPPPTSPARLFGFSGYFLCFYKNVVIVFFFYFFEKFYWNFDRSFIEATDGFELYGYFYRLILQIYEHGISFCSFVFSSVFASVSCSFQYYLRVFTCLVKFGSKDFILLDVIVNGIVFFIFQIVCC